MDYSVDNVVLVGSINYPLYRFDNRSIVLNSLSGIITVDTIGNELSVDTFSLTVRHDPRSPALYAPVGEDAYETSSGALYSLATPEGRLYMTELPFGTPIYWYAAGSLLKKCYIRSINRVGKYAWTIEAISGVGLLDSSYHAGDVYTGQTFEEIFGDIVGDAFGYAIAEDLAEQIVFGWLPYDTRRNNLHRLLFALGANLLSGDGDVDYYVAFLPEPDTPETIPDSRIALGGSVEYTLPATGVEVTEHAFAKTLLDETVLLFDAANTDIVGDQFALFEAPAYDLTATGDLEVLESGANFAKVRGYGKLYGKQYAHTQAVVRKGTGVETTSRVKRVMDNCLVSAFNSDNLAQRVLAYFSSYKSIGARIQMSGESCGTPYAFNDAFGDATLAYLKQMQISVTSIKAARCTLIQGYVPQAQGNTFLHTALITSPVSTASYVNIEHRGKLRIVIIGGGEGGAGGDAGHGYGRESGVGAKDGGMAGTPGHGGKTLTISLDNIPLDATRVDFQLGAGGAGGAGGTAWKRDGGLYLPPAAGSIGADTTVTIAGQTYSSADGAVPESGGVNYMGQALAIPGLPGVDGGRGSSGQTVTVEYNGESWESGTEAETIFDDEHEVYAGGGFGGGPAVGADGGDGSHGHIVYKHYQEEAGWAGNGGGGGYGGDADDADAVPIPGQGGQGGHGGGGGGSGGRGSGFMGATGATGVGGDGGDGGDGGSGCIIIYY